jgi:hypothetical protein
MRSPLSTPARPSDDSPPPGESQVTEGAIPQAVLAELAAAVYVVLRSGGVADLELSGDSRANLRLRTKSIRGVSSQRLARGKDDTKP